MLQSITRWKAKVIGNKYVRYFLFNFISLIIFWGGMLRKSFTSDTITHMFTSDADIQVNLEQGRYLRALMDYVLLKFGMRTTTNLSIAMGAAFVILAVTMTVLQHLFADWESKEVAPRIAFNMIINLWIYNVLFAEVLMFSEMSVVFALAYLFGAVATECYKKKKYIWMLVSLAVASCFYQYAVIFAAICIAFYIFVRERKLSAQVVVRELLAVSACILIGVMNLLSILVLVRVGVLNRFYKSAGTGNLKEKLHQLVLSLVSLHKDAAGIFPSLWIPLIFIILIESLVIVECIKRKSMMELLFLQLVSLGSVALLYVIPFAQENFFFPPRMSFCFFMIQGMIAMSGFIILDSGWKQQLLMLCVLGYLLINILFADFIVTNHFVSNTLDKVYVRMTYEKIEKYERDTGNEVENLCVVKDIDAPSYYDEVNYTSDQINERSLGILSVSIMKIVTGREFNKVEMDPKVYETYFKDRNWDYFDPEEQIVIIGDTAYWCVF